MSDEKNWTNCFSLQSPLLFWESELVEIPSNIILTTVLRSKKNIALTEQTYDRSKIVQHIAEKNRLTQNSFLQKNYSSRTVVFLYSVVRFISHMAN